MLLLLFLSLTTGLVMGSLSPHSSADFSPQIQEYCPVLYQKPPSNCRAIPKTFIDFSLADSEPPKPDREVLEDAFETLEILQEKFFDADYGTWPSAIDWTGAVTQTVIAGMLRTLTKSLGNVSIDNQTAGWKAKENLISSYFADLVNSYFGQDIVSLRGEAYDDMLWVVLGWLEAIHFVEEHSSQHYQHKSTEATPKSRLEKALRSSPWHGSSWVTSFAHRARIFWNLASRGWDTKLCGGGMIWDRGRNPYKNAITNELWISASITMYRFFPGDNITSPWLVNDQFRRKDPAHLAAAIEGYGWLKGINMRNHLGLFVDGYHISGRPGNTQCDLRDEMVYTYNQGVLLTGHRGLWTMTGSVSYLEDGHELIQSVIRATGWHLKDSLPIDEVRDVEGRSLPPWRGIGRGGVMEERCDASGTCSQDGQTFKGIFFHHFTAFCAPLDPITVEPGYILDVEAYDRARVAHAEACQIYAGWVRHNALAAMGTRDSEGVFGMWWGAGLFAHGALLRQSDDSAQGEPNVTDYRNRGTPQDDIWGTNHPWTPGHEHGPSVAPGGVVLDDVRDQQVMRNHRVANDKSDAIPASAKTAPYDPNNRGRGRSLETQMSGLALLRAYWEMSAQPNES